jgi:hypothetical protein
VERQSCSWSDAGHGHLGVVLFHRLRQV